MKKAAPPHELTLYLREWMVLKAVTNRELYKALKETADITESYISNLKANRKDGVSAQVMFHISEALGITVNDLYRPPPTLHQIESISALSTKAQDLVLNRRRPQNR